MVVQSTRRMSSDLQCSAHRERKKTEVFDSYALKNFQLFLFLEMFKLLRHFF